MPSQILPMSNRSLDSSFSSAAMMFKAKDDDNNPSTSLLLSSSSLEGTNYIKPILSRASSFTSPTHNNNNNNNTMPVGAPYAYQKRRRRASSEDSLPSLHCDTAPINASSFGRDVRHVASETFLLTRLFLKMLTYLGLGYKWITRFLALGCYAILLLPGFIQVGYYYFFSSQIRRSIVYGDKPRNRLDLYLPKNNNGPKPVVAFITGGAWVIGYKAWGSLLGQQLADRDIIVACIDYRNFPQGTISDMVTDASEGISFVCNNIAEYGGDPNRIYLMGQSAGAHIAACVIVEQAIKEAGEGESTSWSLSQIKAYFGLSGGYNLLNLIDHFHRRGLYRSLVLSIMEGEESLRRFSPEVMIQDPNIGNAASLLPSVVLYHGTADQSIPSDASKSFAETLKSVGVRAESILYEGKSHTDVFLQDPMRGGKDDLFEDIVAYIHTGDAEACARDAVAPPRRRLVPECMLLMARSISPF
ncbi:isoprenylcysteine alpha-carbonyl methylesterase ICME-like [Abrus precatorius]|uniref:protein-S-isoprenylcysteine alpha-carbonyl methylesterase n=1 Tax=Abrus precatorius TaxID=3816 RepID=A0A8B8KPQ4_ABRPR|nr:isoprenylcysteine alpha-carbonyl methylesterase ICME-like [Abrus precatorius]